MFKKGVFFLLIVGFMLGSVTIFAGGSQEQADEKAETTGGPVEISIGASPPGGSWYPTAIAMGDLLAKGYAELHDNELKFSIGIAGGTGNVMAVDSGEMSFGLTDGSVANAGYKGTEPYEKEFNNIRSLIVLEPAAYQYVCLKEKDIYEMEDLKGKSVNAMPRGFGSEVTNKLILSAFDMSYDDFSRVEHLGYSESVNLLRDNRVDAVLFATCAFPHSAIIELSTVRDIRILGFTEEEVKRIREVESSFTPFIMPAGTYEGQDEDILTVADNEVLIVNKDVSDDVAYAMTKSIIENIKVLGDVNAALKDLVPKNMAQEFGIPVHPGAQKYFEEVGLK